MTRKILVGLLTAMVAMSVAGPATASSESRPGVERWDIEEFYADFDYRTSAGTLRSYMVMAELVRDSDSGKILKKKVYAGIIPCEKQSDGTQSCGGRIHRQRLITWRSDEAFKTATLVFANNGQRHRLHFEADDPYDASGTEQGLRCYGVYLYELALNAYATGTLFGRSVDTRKDVDRSMEQMERYTRWAVCT